MPHVNNVGDPPQVLKYLRRDIGPRPETLARIEQIQSLRSQGKTLKEVGELLGISRQRVHALINRDEYGRVYGAEATGRYRRKARE